ncbi:MAG: TetR/AcrR family transcriptional regulator [Pseudomonadota bacterium]
MPKEKDHKRDINRQDVLDAALSEAAQVGWDMMTMRDIAAACNGTLADVQAHFTDKFDIAVAFGRHIDALVLQRLADTNDAMLSPRDRLFDVLMARFDVMNAYRPAIQSMIGAMRVDPKQALWSAPYLARSMAWMLEQAGMDTTGMRGCARVAGITGIYMYAVKTWAEDDSADMAKTMATLDKALGHAEKWADKISV